jgi:Copper amine oxidase N-terminal domain
MMAALLSAGTLTATVDAQTSANPPPDFGTAPSGEVPILFNDTHVYSKPDALRSGRLLAALVRGGSVLIPLRSMFEQMGATVSYDPSTRTADVSKPGADVKVTVGSSEVMINGESRPLDVAPIMYHGTVMVPVRVISEGMGAYVQWVPDRHVVVVRYVAAAAPTPPPAPTEAPTPLPTAPPTMAPTAAPRPLFNHRRQEHFIVGDYDFSNRVQNAFQSGMTKGHASYSGRVGSEFKIGNTQLMVEGDATGYSYNTRTGPVTNVGGTGQTVVNSFSAYDRDIDARLGVQVLKPRIYLAASYLWQNHNYGQFNYPTTRGWGAGIEKLPDLDHALSLFGSYYYYPNVQGRLASPIGPDSYLTYRVSKYQAGVAYAVPAAKKLGGFFEGGWQGERDTAKFLAPSDYQHDGWFGGFGVKF